MTAKSLKKQHRERYTKLVEVDGRTQRMPKRNYVSLKEWARQHPDGVQWLKRKKS